MKQVINRLGQMLIMLMLATLVSVNSVQAATARDEVESLVRALGYGAAIHNFKNYVLRGRQQYYVTAKKLFADSMQNLTQLEKSASINAEDKIAIDVIRNTITAYQAGLDRIPQLHDKAWRLEDIDYAVTVDDSAAIAALAHLRAKWQWSDLEEIEYQMGYGKAIHNFKNYVLRQQEHYHTQALENFLAVESLIVNQFNTGQLDKSQLSALEKISRVAQSYRNYLSLVGRLHAMQRSTRQIDLAVKVNDEPAVTALAEVTRW